MTDEASKTPSAAVDASTVAAPVFPASPRSDGLSAIFVSHSSRDAQAAMSIVNALEAGGVTCWVAPRDVPAGSDYNAAIMTGINACPAMLRVYSRHSAESGPVAREVERALNRRVPVIPVRLESAAPSPALEFMISTSQWVDAFPPPLDRHLDTVVAAVKKALHLVHAAPRPDPNAPPKYVGPYRILESLGHGGMGTLYRAEQRSPVKRTVAVKVIKPGFDSTEVIARFESERQAMARMDHPNVAKVLDAGADALGRPYFVMEYVPGVPITQYADDNRLTIRQRLELFTQACEAIAHAHTKALIHRDVKAGNVLAYTADGKPHVKVIDFGIAKALVGDHLTDRTFNTERGQAIGTYESMSPEQADGSPDIDTRTDVYSLGVLLYELLAGAKPFDRDTLANAADVEVRRIIREVEPPRPSTRLSSLGGEATRVAAARQVRVEMLARELQSKLEWIPLKAMRKERERRYAGPLQLASDIRNYLENKPLLAGPESAAYRLRKLVRRNKVPVTAAAAALITLIAGVAVSTTLWVRAQKLADANGRLAADKTRLADEKTRLADEKTRLAVENGTLASQKSAAADLAESRLAESLLAQGDAAVQASRWSDAGRFYSQARDAQRSVNRPTTAADFGLANVSLLAPPPFLELHTGARGSGSGVPVAAAAISMDGRVAAAGLADGHIVLWESPSGRRIATLIGHPGARFRAVAGLVAS